MINGKPYVVACVAGVSAPAFVERRSGAPGPDQPHSRVAGVSAPAFVERCLQGNFYASLSHGVSPGSRPRPSLSGVIGEGCRLWRTPRVSPGSRPRPSLSALSLRRYVGGTEPSCRRGLGPGLR